MMCTLHCKETAGESVTETMKPYKSNDVCRLRLPLNYLFSNILLGLQFFSNLSGQLTGAWQFNEL